MLEEFPFAETGEGSISLYHCSVGDRTQKSAAADRLSCSNSAAFEMMEHHFHRALQLHHRSRSLYRLDF